MNYVAAFIQRLKNIFKIKGANYFSITRIKNKNASFLMGKASKRILKVSRNSFK